MRYRLSTLLIALSLAVPVPSTLEAAGQPGRDKLDRALQKVLDAGGGSPTHRVIVRSKPGKRAALGGALKQRGRKADREHPSIDGVSAEVSAADLAALAGHPAIESISIDAEVSAAQAPGQTKKAGSVYTPLVYSKNDKVSTLRAALGLESTAFTGAGIGVAVIDSGIEPSDDFAGRISAFYDFTRGGGVAASPSDDYGHGTHVAGLIGGDGTLSHREYMGVAPRVRLIGLKVLDGRGRGLTSNVVSAIEFAVANRQRLGIQVLNLSLGHPIFEPAATDPLVQAVEQAVRAGLIVVTSAGNVGRSPETGAIGYAGITSPGNAPSAITIGSLDLKNSAARSDDRVTKYSSRGPSWYDAFAKPDLVAPGDKLVSNTGRTSSLYKDNRTLRVKSPHPFMRLSGTSMAAGVASGVVALVLEANRAATSGGTPVSPPPALTANAVKAILQFTAFRLRDEYGVEYDSLTQGAGGINADGAIALASAIDPSVPVGAPWLTTAVEPYTTIGGETLAWAQNIVWGNNIVWGHNIVWANNIVWGHQVVWGASETDAWATNVVWGENVVWGSNIVWANNIVWGFNLVGTVEGENIVWGCASGRDNVVWGNLSLTNIVWGNNLVWGFGDEGDDDSVGGGF